MNGVVFHTSAMMTAKRDAHGSVVHAIEVPSILLAMPFSAKMKNHSFAVTAVGIAHGISTLARSRDRPQKVLPITVAIHRPRSTSIATVTTAKKIVTPAADQKSCARVPGGHVPAPPPQSCTSHCR